MPDLQELGIPESDLDSLRASTQALRLGNSGINQARLDAEYRNVLRLLEQLELGLADNASPGGDAGDTQVEAAEVSESAAEYYRQLSETPRRATR